MPEKRLLGVWEVGEVGGGEVTLEEVEILEGEDVLEVETAPALKGALVGCVSLPSLTWGALATGDADMVEVIGIESDLWRRS